jgi:FMN reductase
MSIVLLSGSPSSPSRSARLLELVGRRLNERGHDTELLTLRDLPAQALLRADTHDRVIAEAVEKVVRSKALVIATPVYKAAYSGLVKTFLDLLAQDGLLGKVVLPLATAGSPAHVLALDYALRPVLQSLGPAQILGGVYATDRQVRWDDSTGLSVDEDIEWRISLAVDQLDESLHLRAQSHRLRRAGGEAGEGLVAQRC